MDDPHEYSLQTADTKNALPDVVHSQQIPAVGAVGLNSTDPSVAAPPIQDDNPDVEESHTESISEHIPSKVEYSTDSDNEGVGLEVDGQQKISVPSSGNILELPLSPISDHPSQHNPSKESSSWPLDENMVSDVHLISEESPVNLALSSDVSKEATRDCSQTNQPKNQHESLNESLKCGEYLDSLYEESSHKSHTSQESAESNKDEQSLHNYSSGSEEIIKLDIRGQGAPKFPFTAAKIIFGPPPEGSTIIEPSVKQIPLFPNLLSPFLVGASDTVNIEEIFDDKESSPVMSRIMSPLSEKKDEDIEDPPHSPSSTHKIELGTEVSPKESLSDKNDQSDLLVEELTVEEEIKQKENQEDSSLPPKSMPPEETMSFSTMTTDYKTICEEYHAKLVHLEAAITQRDDLIEELTVSLQRSFREREDLKSENQYLTSEVCNLQHAVATGEQMSSDQDTIKAQISDFMKYQCLIKDDSTKFYSALMSGGSSLPSSNGERDNDREEITVNYSRSDLRSSESDDFQTGFENKIATIMSKFDEYIEENLRNKLRESLIQVLCNEIGKMRLEFDTEVKELESQAGREKQTHSIEARRLRELLASVKAGSADVDQLRQELALKHEKEMENLRTYFEKKCSDMERSYSEEVWRGACGGGRGSPSPPPSPPSPEGSAGGDHRRRARSAEPPSLSLESTPVEQAVKQIAKKYEQQIEEMRAEHVAYVQELQTRQREMVVGFEEQISQLKTLIQTSESNVMYPQDIDLELEKKMEAQLEQRLEEVREEVRQDVVTQLQEQLQVLLADPDAEVSSWPLELVALRDKIHGDAQPLDKDLSSLKEELSAGEDKWKQRRNLSFDQNRQLDEVTRERDELRRVAVSLHRVVGQLVAYCASAEDELNRTVLAHLWRRLRPAAAAAAVDCSAWSEEGGGGDESLELGGGGGGGGWGGGGGGGGKHVHFAPDLDAVLADLDESTLATLATQQRDLSGDIKRQLETSLRRLREEAHSLLLLSERLPAKNHQESKMLESSAQISELVEEMDSKLHCENCELHRKNMEEAMSECLQRENLLRADLEAALMKIAQLMTSADVIAEGYGTDAGLPRAARRPHFSLPSVGSPRSPPLHSPHSPLPHSPYPDYDQLQREKDDLQQQLEAANRQLRATRQFVEEQAAEREAERDDFAGRERGLREDNSRLAARLQASARILNEVEQLEAQTREMNQIIADLETKKAATDDQLKATEEKIILLRDIISNYESQLEQKVTREKEILEQLEEMKNAIDDRDAKMRAMLVELQSLKDEKLEQSQVACLKCAHEEDSLAEMMQKLNEQCSFVSRWAAGRTRVLERVHEEHSAASEPSEDVSRRDRLLQDVWQTDGCEEGAPPPWEGAPPTWEGAALWEGLQALARAEGAALKRLADLAMQRDQLHHVAQEVRAERDVLQARMSEQALKISSLSARLQQHRNDAEALSHLATAQLQVQLHDALAQVNRLNEELDSKDKQLTRLKLSLEEKDKLNEQHHSLYGNSCNPKDKVIILERELSSAQSRIAQLEQLARSLEADKDGLVAALTDHRRALAEKEHQLQELLALNLDEENKEEKSELVEGKASARTLSDIVSISEFDEQDLQMRRAEMKALNLSVSGAPFPTGTQNKTHLNKTLPPEVQRPNISSLNIEYADHFELPNYTPRADSLPAHLTSTQNKDVNKEYKRNANETTMFGTIDTYEEKCVTAQKIHDNCSMYPNKEVNESKNNTVEPKKINFSLEPTIDNKSNDEEFTSLRELGITLDIKQENFPDILTQLKHEIKKSRVELETCKSELKNAEEQLCEFPALKEEVEKLKALLENTMATMTSDKKFYENQLDNFSANKKLLEQRLTEFTQEANDKSKDLHMLKEDILRRENMILELAKEKRNLTNRMSELELKIDELQSRNTLLEKCESDNHQLRDKVSELNRLEQLVTEKNQQIDSLNQHLDRLDDLQRCLNDKTEEFDNLKEAFEEKSNELFQLQDTVEALNRDIARLNDENDNLNSQNKELKLKLTKLEKEQENASLKLQNSESELERVNSLNTELTSKIEEFKIVTEKLKDKETEIEILNEDINSFHEEIATLKELLKMVSRSPSPRSKSGDERKTEDGRVSADKKQLVKIRKQISLMQHELDFNKKELNDQAFELAKAKLDVTELRNSLSQASKQAADKACAERELTNQCSSLQQQLGALAAEKSNLQQQLDVVVARLREESNIGELKAKLQQQEERCRELEAELEDLRNISDRAVRAGGSRSPTAALERAVRDQLHYSHALDETIMDQILSASSDEREDIPRLALDTSKSSSSIQSSSSERLQRLRTENEKLVLRADHLEARLKDKDALIAELNRVRGQLQQELASGAARLQAQADHCRRLQAALDAHRETSLSLQNQDTNMIGILMKRLESSMQSEVELQQREQQLKARLTTLEAQLMSTEGQGDEPLNKQLQHEVERNCRLSGEVSLLRSRLEVERARALAAGGRADRARLRLRAERAAAAAREDDARRRLAELGRLKHESSVELARTKELVATQGAALGRLAGAGGAGGASGARPLNEMEGFKSELVREVTVLKQQVSQPPPAATGSPRGDQRDQALRYFQGRCLRLESCRKALVWQKRYLQRVIAGYTAIEQSLKLVEPTQQPKRRFKCLSRAVSAVVRMSFLVRRRLHVRDVAARALLAARPDTTLRNGQFVGSSVWGEEAGAARADGLGAATPQPPRTPQPPPTPQQPPTRRALRQEQRLSSPTPPALLEYSRRSPCNTSLPREEPFILSSPRGEVAAAYLNKLELVSRCLSHAMDADRDVP